MQIDTATAKEIAALQDEKYQQDRKANIYSAEWQRLCQARRKAVTGGEKALKVRQRELNARILTEDAEAIREELANITEQLAEIELATPPAIEQVRHEELKWRAIVKQTAEKIKQLTIKAAAADVESRIDAESIIRQMAEAAYQHHVRGNCDDIGLGLQMLRILTGTESFLKAVAPVWNEMDAEIQSQVDQYRCKQEG